MNRYKSALFGYNGNINIAAASNARDNEIAFESFENCINPYDYNDGNFDMARRHQSDEVMPVINKCDKYVVTGAYGSKITINKPYSQCNTPSKVLIAHLQNTPEDGGWVFNNMRDFKSNFYSLPVSDCQVSRMVDGNTYINVTNTEFSTNMSNRLWEGTVGFTKNVQTNSIEVVDNIAHTGSRSMGVTSGGLAMTLTSLELNPSKKYIFSGWVKVGSDPNVSTYANSNIKVKFKFSSTQSSESAITCFKGNVIEGWQRFEFEFTTPDYNNYDQLSIQFINTSGVWAYWDDIRLFPADANMKSFVYEPISLKLKAVLDENNYATIYSYDEEGNLFLIKKETSEGLKTIQESRKHNRMQ